MRSPSASALSLFLNRFSRHLVLLLIALLVFRSGASLQSDRTLLYAILGVAVVLHQLGRHLARRRTFPG